MPSRALPDRREFLLATAALAACGPNRAARISGYLFVANRAAKSIAVIDLSRFTKAQKLELDAAPTAIIAQPEKGRLYALTPSNGTVLELDFTTLAIRRKARLGSHAIAMRMAPGGQTIWMLCSQPNELSGLDLETFKPAGRIKLPGLAADFDTGYDYDSRQNAAVFSLPGMHAVAIASLDTRRLNKVTDIGVEPRVIRLRPDGRQILTGNTAARTVTVLETATGNALVNLAVPLQPERFCYNANGGQLFITGAGMDAVVIVDPYHTNVSETVLAGRAPGNMAVSSDPAYLFVANPRTDDVTVIDIPTRRVLVRIPVGAEPCSILVTPANHYALVLNERSGDVAVIRLSVISALVNRRAKTAPLFTLIPVGSGPVSGAIYSV